MKLNINTKINKNLKKFHNDKFIYYKSIKNYYNNLKEYEDYIFEGQELDNYLLDLLKKLENVDKEKLLKINFE